MSADLDVVLLRETGECPPDRYGWKASRLYHLMTAGLPVVDGFVIGAAEYQRHLRLAGLGPTSSADAVRAAEMHSPLRALVTALSAGFEAPFAVRSSGLVEDGEGGSLAGWYRTSLDVDRPDLARAVVETWASAHPQPAVAAANPAVAVLVQPMLRADAFGVASSVEPTSAAASLVIEVGRHPSTVTEGSEPLARYTLAKGSATPAVTGQNVLDSDQLAAIASTVAAVARLSDSQVEVEFGVTASRCVVLQVRPVAPRAVDHADFGAPSGTWILDEVHYEQPLTTLYESIFPPIVRSASAAVFSSYGVFADAVELRTFGRWAYVGVRPLVSTRMPNAPGWLIGLAARAHPRLRQRLDRSAAALRSDLPRRDLERWRDVTMPSTVEFVEGWYDTDLSSAGTEAVRAALKASVQQLSSVVTANFETDFAHLIPVAQFLGRVESSHGIAAAEALALVQRCSRRDSLLPAALAGLAADLSRSDRVLARLRDVSTRSLDEAVAGDSGAESALARHRRRWGFTLLSYDLEGPTIREAPEFELRALAAYLGAPRVLDRPAADPGALSADERRLLRAAGEWFHVREEGEAVKALLLGLIRTLALELGRRSAAGTARPQGELALHATLAELLSVAGPLSDEQRRMLLRRERERRVAARRAPPPLLGPKPRRSPSTAWLPAASRDIHRAAAALASNDMLPGVESAESTLVGLGVSSGTHSGRVRIVRSIPDFSAIERDDVVVTTITSSPLMAAVPNIGALVTESGGALSHVAIVARAMDIPAVVSVAAATRILVDGEPVTVNGTAGTIRRTTLLDKNVPS